MINSELERLRYLAIAGDTIAYRASSPNAEGDHAERARDIVVLLLHGMGNSSAVWGPLHTDLADRGIDAVAVDIPGHGESTLRSRRPDFDAIADLLEGFTEQLDAPTVIAVGHSLGAVLALELAVRLPQKVSSLLLVAGPPLDMMDLYDEPLKTARAKPRVLRQFSLLVLAGLPGAGVATRAAERSLAWFRTSVRGADAAPASAAEADARTQFALQHLGTGRIIATTLGGFGRNYREPYRAIKQPCIALLGADDRLTDAREIAEFLETFAGTSNVIVWPEVGHMPMLEAVPDTVSLVLSIVDGDGQPMPGAITPAS